MVEVVRDLGGMPVFDALKWPYVTRAWQTVLGCPDLRPVTTGIAWVGLPYDGYPPDDAEVVRLSGLDPSANGIIRVPYFEKSEGEVITITIPTTRKKVRQWNFPVAPQRARWGMLVLELSGDE